MQLNFSIVAWPAANCFGLGGGFGGGGAVLGRGPVEPTPPHGAQPHMRVSSLVYWSVEYGTGQLAGAQACWAAAESQ